MIGFERTLWAVVVAAGIGIAARAEGPGSIRDLGDGSWEVTTASGRKQQVRAGTPDSLREAVKNTDCPDLTGTYDLDPSSVTTNVGFLIHRSYQLRQTLCYALDLYPVSGSPTLPTAPSGSVYTADISVSWGDDWGAVVTDIGGVIFPHGEDTFAPDPETLKFPVYPSVIFSQDAHWLYDADTGKPSGVTEGYYEKPKYLQIPFSDSGVYGKMTHEQGRSLDLTRFESDRAVLVRSYERWYSSGKLTSRNEAEFTLLRK
jgi:hypothetical protein